MDIEVKIEGFRGWDFKSFNVSILGEPFKERKKNGNEGYISQQKKITAPFIIEKIRAVCPSGLSEKEACIGAISLYALEEIDFRGGVLIKTVTKKIDNTGWTTDVSYDRKQNDFSFELNNILFSYSNSKFLKFILYDQKNNKIGEGKITIYGTDYFEFYVNEDKSSNLEIIKISNDNYYTKEIGFKIDNSENYSDYCGPTPDLSKHYFQHYGNNKGISLKFERQVNNVYVFSFPDEDTLTGGKLLIDHKTIPVDFKRYKPLWQYYDFKIVGETEEAEFRGGDDYKASKIKVSATLKEKSINDEILNTLSCIIDSPKDEDNEWVTNSFLFEEENNCLDSEKKLKIKCHFLEGTAEVSPIYEFISDLQPKNDFSSDLEGIVILFNGTTPVTKEHFLASEVMSYEKEEGAGTVTVLSDYSAELRGASSIGKKFFGEAEYQTQTFFFSGLPYEKQKDHLVFPNNPDSFLKVVFSVKVTDTVYGKEKIYEKIVYCHRDMSPIISKIEKSNIDTKEIRINFSDTGMDKEEGYNSQDFISFCGGEEKYKNIYEGQEKVTFYLKDNEDKEKFELSLSESNFFIPGQDYNYKVEDNTKYVSWTQDEENYYTIDSYGKTPTVVYLPNQIGINCTPEGDELIRIEKLSDQGSPAKIVIGNGITIKGLTAQDILNVLTAQDILNVLNSNKIKYIDGTWSTST